MTLEGRALVIRPVGYDEAAKAAVYRAMPAAAWSRGRGRWEAPATVGALARLSELQAHLINFAGEQGGNGRVEMRMSEEVSRATLEAVCALAPRGEPSDLLPSYYTGPSSLVPPTVPWRHQVMAWHFLYYARQKLGSALLDMGMRTGKTRVVLDHFQGLDERDRRGLVLCPKSVVPVWAEQAARHCAPGRLRVVVLERGTVAERVDRACELLLGEKPTVVVMGWAVLERLSLDQKRRLRAALNGATIVADEVHAAKSPGSSRSQALAYVGREAAMRIGASGTPLSHSPLDAYGVFRFLDPGIWGQSFARFREQYAVMGGYGGHQVLSHRNLDDLAARMRPYTFRAGRDVLDLPPAQDIDVPVTLPPAAAATYVSMREEAVAELRSGVLTATNSLAKLTRLAEIASGYLPSPSGGREVLHREKEAALVDLLESCDPAEPWVVFSRFTHDVEATRRAAEKACRPHCELSGSRRELETWKTLCAADAGPVLAAQVQAGGTGVDMSEASFAAFMSVGYSLSDYLQARARIHGPGSKKSVAYYHLIAKGTVDVQIRRALAKRADVLAFVAAELVKES